MTLREVSFEGLTAHHAHLADREFWRRPGREDAFARLRALGTVTWHEGTPYTGRGFWAVVRHAQIAEVTKDQQTFSSTDGVHLVDRPEVAPERRVFESILNLDDPHHLRLRRLIASGFTPRTISKLEASIRERSRAIVDNIAAKGSCEFVEEVAGVLPLGVICDLVGVPASEQRRMYDLANVIAGHGDPEYGGSQLDAVDAAWEIYQLGLELVQLRQDRPTDDLTSLLVQAELDGDRLTPREVALFFVLLVAAGAETTRNAISHGLVALTRFPAQRQIWMDRFDELAVSAVDEIVRWASPVIHMRRTVTTDTVFHGASMAKGDKVVLFYASGNRDESVFANPDSFEVTRSPNPHHGFGAPGTHFCLGAHLARRETAIMLGEVFRRLPDIEVDGEPSMLWSPFMHGIKRLPVRFSPTR